MPITLNRVYDTPSPSDGQRILTKATLATRVLNEKGGRRLLSERHNAIA
ncbi:MAG: hypothetical protein IIC18_10270 [Bacteroidetes bacterium]|nr:hypothetical protein [Bacteroidota bacterium]